MSKLSVLLFSSFLLLVSCASPYRPEGLTGGYSEIQLDKNIYQVSFRGNGYTSPERATNLVLLRSAEIALQNGYSYFIIVNSTEYSKYSTYTTPTRAETTGGAFSTGGMAYGRATTTVYGGQTHLIAKPRTTKTIICFKEKPKKTNNVVYNAENVYASLSKYK